MNRTIDRLTTHLIGLAAWGAACALATAEPAATPLLDRCPAPAADTAAEPVCHEANDGPEQSNPSPIVPVDVCTPSPPFTFKCLQPRFDLYSWETFIALNWPMKLSGGDGILGAPEGSEIGKLRDNLTVWELWKEHDEVFLDRGAPPAEWGSQRQPLAKFSQPCRDAFFKAQVALREQHKPLAILEAAKEPFDSGPLIDQNGRYARFEILLNQTMFDYIVTNNLYSKDGQTKHEGHAVFPSGKPNGQACERKEPIEQGSIMIKASWKVLSAAEIASGRFHTAECFLYTPVDEEQKTLEHFVMAKMGLVGLHIVHKTPTRPQWIWSTFEHVDNCPVQGEPIPEDREYSFFFNRSEPGLLAINSPPIPPWIPTKVEEPTKRSRIMRMIPITDEVKRLNAAFQKKLRGSVWEYYQLISTQWPSGNPRQPGNKPLPEDSLKADPATVIAMPAPQFLGNSTLESYVPGKVVNVSSSCIECHANATATNTEFADFTFLLLRAE